ncbi:hypothetical protein KM043_005188 [Ampulex compressa]|nr:hypothetical protein KM043_005188 [Ampulex compressa]
MSENMGARIYLARVRRARKIEEHKRKRERRAQEKVEHDKQEKLKKTKDTTKTEEELKNAFQAQSGVGPSTSDFFKFINNVDVLQACRDPEVRNAFFDISADFNNISKYVDNPKVLMLLQKCMGGMPGFPDTRRPEESATDPKPQDDVNLD